MPKPTRNLCCARDAARLTLKDAKLRLKSFASNKNCSSRHPTGGCGPLSLPCRACAACR
jgi:hypothetical protein